MEVTKVGMTMMVQKTDIEKGSFKVAYKATCEPCIPEFAQNIVCAKQAYVKDTNSKPSGFPAFDDQVSLLRTEMKSLVWAAALLDHVYEFIDSRNPSPVIDIPRLSGKRLRRILV